MTAAGAQPRVGAGSGRGGQYDRKPVADTPPAGEMALGAAPGGDATDLDIAETIRRIVADDLDGADVVVEPVQVRRVDEHEDSKGVHHRRSGYGWAVTVDGECHDITPPPPGGEGTYTWLGPELPNMLSEDAVAELYDEIGEDEDDGWVFTPYDSPIDDAIVAKAAAAARPLLAGKAMLMPPGDPDTIALGDEAKDLIVGIVESETEPAGTRAVGDWRAGESRVVFEDIADDVVRHFDVEDTARELGHDSHVGRLAELADAAFLEACFWRPAPEQAGT